jgi:hypothetical protein
MSNPTALQVLAYGARSKGRRLAVESLRRTIDVCSCCHATVETDTDACEGAAIEQIEVWSPKVALGLLDGSRRSLELQGLVLPAYLMASGGAA